MRVRYVIGEVDSPGTVVHAAAVAGHLADRGHDTEVWAPAARTLLPRAARERVRLVELPSPAAPAAGIADMLARRALVDGVADIHHAQDPAAAAALIELRTRGLAPVVVRTVHHLEAAATHSLAEMQRVSLQDVDACVCVSAAWAERLSSELAVESVVIPNGLDPGRVSAPGLGRAEAGALFGWGARPVVLAMGGIARRKGGRVLLEAFARARARLGKGALLVVAGATAVDEPDYRRAWFEDAEWLGLTVGGPSPAPHVDVALIGSVGGDDLAALYRAVDVLAHPSTREGSGMLVLEAAAGGVPAVVSDIDGLRDELVDDRDCLMVPPGHSAPLADALVRLMRDEELRARIVNGARDTGAARDWGAAARAHERLYQRLLSASEGGGDGRQAGEVGGFVVQGGHRDEAHRGQRRP